MLKVGDGAKQLNIIAVDVLEYAAHFVSILSCCFLFVDCLVQVNIWFSCLIANVLCLFPFIFPQKLSTGHSAWTQQH